MKKLNLNKLFKNKPDLIDDLHSYYDEPKKFYFYTEGNGLVNNLSYQAVVKAGGFVNRNNKFILESSQDKGRVFVPEENITTVLYTSKPDIEYFYGGIKIDKSANGYTINGFDNSLAYFKYNKPNTATDGITTSFSGVTNVNVLR